MRRKVSCICGCAEFTLDFPVDPYEHDLERSHRLGVTVRALCAKCGKEISFAPTRSRTQLEVSMGAVLKEETTVTEGVNHG